jgi:hypothetical protein
MPPSLQNPDPISSPQLDALTRALRFFVATIVVGLSYPNIRLALSIVDYQQLYHDMLGNKPLPPITTFFINYSWLFDIVAIILPFAAIALVFSRNAVRSIYLCGWIILVLFCVLFFEWHALIVPITAITQGFQGGPDTLQTILH